MPREKVSSRRSLHERPTLSIYVTVSPSPSLRVDSVEGLAIDLAEGL